MCRVHLSKDPPFDLFAYDIYPGLVLWCKIDVHRSAPPTMWMQTYNVIADQGKSLLSQPYPTIQRGSSHLQSPTVPHLCCSCISLPPLRGERACRSPNPAKHHFRCPLEMIEVASPPAPNDDVLPSSVGAIQIFRDF
jgi:hypothetical protein